MKRIILLNSILLLSSVWAVAQYENNSGSPGNTKKMTVEGCIEGAVGNYTLTDYAGTAYRLTGNMDQLRDHVGGIMQVTGLLYPVTYVPGAMSEGTETRPLLSVLSLKQISAVCGDTY